LPALSVAIAARAEEEARVAAASKRVALRARVKGAVLHGIMRSYIKKKAGFVKGKVVLNTGRDQSG